MMKIQTTKKSVVRRSDIFPPPLTPWEESAGMKEKVEDNRMAITFEIVPADESWESLFSLIDEL